MPAFEFLTAFVSILIGLAIADLATSLHRLLRAGRRVKWDWAAPTAAVIVAIQVTAQFWSFWFSHTERTYSFAALSGLAAVLVLAFLMASAALPDAVPAEGLDLRRFYEDNGRYFWSLVALYTTAVTIQEWDTFLAPDHRVELALNGIGLANMVALAAFRWRWLHALGLAGYLAVQISRYFVWTTTSGF